MGIFRNVMVKAVLPHQDQCAQCKGIFDCEELHTINDNVTDTNVPMCTKCIEQLACEQETQDHDEMESVLPYDADADDFDPDELG